MAEINFRLPHNNEPNRSLVSLNDDRLIWLRRCCRSERRRLAKLVQEQRDQQETEEGTHGVHGPPVADAGEELRKTEIPQRAGPDGTGGETQFNGHTSENVVPEQEVSNLTGRDASRWRARPPSGRSVCRVAAQLKAAVGSL